MKMNGKDLFALMGKLDDRYVAAASYLAKDGENKRYESPTRRRASAFFQSGWFVAILCAVVSFSVVSAIIWAGQRDPGVMPPATSQSGQLTETETENGTELLLELPENVKVETEQETTDEGAHRQKVTFTILDCTNQPYDLVFYVTPHPKYEYHHVCNPPQLPWVDEEGGTEHQHETHETTETATGEYADIDDICIGCIEWSCEAEECRTQIGWYYMISELQRPSEQHYLPIDENKYLRPYDEYFCRFFGSIQEAIDFACEMITEPVHTQYVVYDFINATCLENGHNGKTVCYACDKVFEDLGRHLATGHKLVNNQCSVCGIVAGEGLLFVPYGNGTCYIAGFAEDASDRTQAVIPLYAPNGDRVVTIAEGAFAGCDDLICVQLPPTIRRIEADAFTDCPNLSVLYSNVSRDNWRIDVVKIAGWCDESLKLNFGDHWAYWTPDGKTHDYVAP